MNAYLKTPPRATSRILLPNFTAGLETRFDEAVTELSLAAELYNFDCSTGALTDGWGLADPKLEEVEEAWTFRKDGTEIRMYRKGQSVYYLDEGAETLLPGVTFTARVLAVNYRLYGEDVVIMCSSADDMAVWNGKDEPYIVEGSPRVTSMALHYERLFVTVKDGNAVYFSDDLDPTNWSMDLSAGGFIELADELGRLNRVVSYLNYVYIFRDYGISRMVAYADQTEFSVSNLFVSSGRIYPETVAVCGDRVLFLAEDGLYAFDGLSTYKAVKGLDRLFAGGAPAADYYGGNYRLAARIRGEGTVGCERGEYINNGLVVYAPGTGAVSVTRGVDVRGFVGGDCIAAGRIFRLTKNGCGTEGPLPKRWRVPFTDLGSPEKVKELAELYVYTEGAVTITAYSERGERSRRFTGAGVKRMRVGLTGRKFGVRFEAEESARISRPRLVIRG